MIFPHNAHAALDCVIESTDLRLGHANIFVVPTTHLQINDPVGTRQDFQMVFRCTASGNPAHWGILNRKVASLTDTGLITPWNVGGGYRVFTTPELQPLGLGFAGFWYALGFDDNDSFKNVNHTEPPFWVPMPIPDGDGHFRFRVRMVYRFIKISAALDAHLDGTPVAVNPLLVLGAFAIIDDLPGSPESPTAQTTVALPTITIGQRACTPFADTVFIPPLNMNDLPPVGAAGPEKEFYIVMRCPTNLGYVGYHAEAVHGVVDAAQGVIAISPGSSAKGIGLQILTRSPHSPEYLDTFSAPTGATYQPMQFSPTARYAVRSYSAGGAGPATVDPLTNPIRQYRASDNTIPLKVAIYRIAQEVTPGTFTAAIRIHFVYR